MLNQLRHDVEEGEETIERTTNSFELYACSEKSNIAMESDQPEVYSSTTGEAQLIRLQRLACQYMYYTYLCAGP